MPASSTYGRRVRALIDATHPGPTAVVTFVIAALAAAAGRNLAGVAMIALAVVLGQASIGWSNDAHDADRDRRAGRAEKPTVRDDITAATLWRVAVLALVLTIALSFVAFGPIGGTAHVIAVLSAWAYNLRLKATVLSPVPYAVSFGLIPTMITFSLTPPTAPAWWATIACALMGVGAHFANALPDIDSDRSVSAGGIVVAIGARASTALCLTTLVIVVALLVFHLTNDTATAIALVAVVSVAALVVATIGSRRALFRFVLVLAASTVGMLLVASTSITA